MFEIYDLCFDLCIDFVGGICGLEELECFVNSGEYKVVFVLYLIFMEDLLVIVDVGEVMLLKLMWFELKLCSGLFVYFLK